MFKIVLNFSLCFISLLSFAQEVKQGLIVVHVEAGGKGDFKQKIYNYHILNGHYVGREELLTIVGKKDGKDYLRTDLGTNQIYNNRYLVTGIGNIIDLKEKKVLFDGRANLVKLANDSAVYYTNDAFKGKYYSVFNFKTNTYGEVKSLTFKAKAGQDVEFDKTTSPYKLFLYPMNKPKIQLVADAGFGQTADGSKPDPLMWWLDNANFIFTYFNKENTEMSFFKVNVDSKSQTLIGKLAINPEKQAARLSKLSATEFLVFIGQKQILIDIAKNQVNDLQFSKEENGFSYECKLAGSGRIVKYKNTESGKYHFQPKNFKTSTNIAAMVKEIVMGADSYQQGLGVWNFNKQKWESVDCEDVLTLVGFINE